MTIRNRNFGWHLLQTIAIVLLVSPPASSAEEWTLTKSVQRAMDVAPEQQEALAGIAVRQGELEQAAQWPNPTVSLRAQNRLGLQDGRGGYNVDQLIISQPLPLWRLQKQQAVAAKQLSAEQAFADQTRLTVQHDIARLYYALVLSHEKLLLAEQRQRFTHGVQRAQSGNTKPVIRYVNPLDRHRIELLDEATGRTLLNARAVYTETLQVFRLRLQLADQEGINLPALQPASAPRRLATLQQRLKKSSATLKQMEYQTEATQAGVDLERFRKFSDPVVSLIHERDFLAGRRQNFNGIMVSVPVPLWDRNQGNVARAEAEVMRNESRMRITRRNLQAQLERSYLNLSQLLEQLRTINKRMVEPAENLLALTRQGYAVGEVSSLNLIDAYNTYFDARNNALDLMYQSQIAAINLHQAVGDPVLGPAGVKP